MKMMNHLLCAKTQTINAICKPQKHCTICMSFLHTKSQFLGKILCVGEFSTCGWIYGFLLTQSGHFVERNDSLLDQIQLLVVRLARLIDHLFRLGHFAADWQTRNWGLAHGSNRFFANMERTQLYLFRAIF